MSGRAAIPSPLFLRNLTLCPFIGTGFDTPDFADYNVLGFYN